MTSKRNELTIGLNRSGRLTGTMDEESNTVNQLEENTAPGFFGTVRGTDLHGPWVLRDVWGRREWVSVMTGDSVSDVVMWAMGLPVTGAVPGTPAALEQEFHLTSVLHSCPKCTGVGSWTDIQELNVAGSNLLVSRECGSCHHKWVDTITKEA